MNARDLEASQCDSVERVPITLVDRIVGVKVITSTVM
jgi:hypothetical protein